MRRVSVLQWQAGCSSDSQNPFIALSGITRRMEMVMADIKHVLCPVDFSECSRHAFGRALAVARGYGADLTVLHVLPMPSAVPALPYGPEGPGPFGFEAVDRDRALTELSRFLGAEPSIGVAVHYEVAEAPSVHKEILLQTAKTTADLVVVGTHGRSGFDHLVLGSVAEKTLRTSRVPVLVVPPHTRDVVPAPIEPFRRVLCAVDFSPDSARALDHATSLARHGGGRLVLLHVVEPIPVGYDPMVGPAFDIAGYEYRLEESGRAQLQKLAPESAAAGCEVETVLARGRAYKEILRVAAERQADVIVLGAHGRNAFDRLVFGSTTEQIIRRARCPVLAVATPEHP
jgi:nucleotide-binding universal stress UspA family protein